MTLLDGVARVSVPATSANLGPGFDALGLALDLRDRLEAEVIPEGLVVEVEGAGSDSVPRDERHLVVRAMRLAFDALGERPTGLRLACHNVIPHARGLGSSSAAIVGGLALARGLVVGGAEQLDDEALFQLAAELEGHPDNVAPACFGGFVISGRDDENGADAPFFAVPSAVSSSLAAIVLIPPDGVETEVARGLLPDEVPHADAASNSGRAALLVAALAGRPDQLLRGTRDLLHQQFRRPAMPATIDLVDDLRSAGVPAIVSGAGPTVLAFTGAAGSAAADDILARCPEGWTALHLALDPRGVLLDHVPAGA
ncbi:homoserine kinase [Nocardioides sp.]|uniref:homoserine kinase n=1 Tax=Nocardioides sp. TaxID=35761 RepID=UPI002B278ED3|nr:homoserine kinase [Nocardioides sp.]